MLTLIFNGKLRELDVTPVMPAVANPIAVATGKRIYRLPLAGQDLRG